MVGAWLPAICASHGSMDWAVQAGLQWAKRHDAHDNDSTDLDLAIAQLGRRQRLHADP